MSGGTASMPPPQPDASTTAEPTAATTAAPPAAAPAAPDPRAATGSPDLPDSRRSSTPRALRRIRTVVLLAYALVAVLGWFDAAARSAAARELVEATGPVLADTQSLRASLAEADSAQAVALVGLLDQGFEDVRTRRAYEDALARASRLVEQIAARLGDADGDDAAVQQRLIVVAELLPRYAGLVEAARAAAPFDRDASEARVVSAIAFVRGDLDAALDDFTTQVNSRLDDALAEQDGLPLLATLAVSAALVATLLASADLSRRTRRTLNPGLVVAALAALAALVWLRAATVTASDEVDRAIDVGFRSITATADLQRAGFTVQSTETLRATGVSADRDLLTSSRAEVDERLEDLVELADTPREAALADEAVLRWNRIADTQALTAGRTSAFNGFVFASEGVLADNREDLLAGLGAARSALDPLPLGLLGLGLLGAAATVAGYRPRLDEYR